LVEHAREPSAFCRQKSGILLVGAPVLEIDLAVGDVPVAADDDLAAAGREPVQMRDHALEELELHSQPFL